MAVKHTPAVVIDVFDHGEADKIVTFYTSGVGKLTGIAKGAKRSKKRFVNKLEFFSWLDLFYDDRSRSSLVRIVEADLCDPFMALRQDYEGYVVASLISQLVIHWTRENDPDADLFALLLWALSSLSSGCAPLRILVLFHTKLLTATGYQPHLQGCMVCGRYDIAWAPYRFHLGRGGLLCRQCHPGSGTMLLPLSLSTAKLLRNAQILPLEKMGRLRFAPVSLQEAAVLLKKYGQGLLQRELQAWDHILPPGASRPPHSG